MSSTFSFLKIRVIFPFFQSSSHLNLICRLSQDLWMNFTRSYRHLYIQVLRWSWTYPLLQWAWGLHSLSPSVCLSQLGRHAWSTCHWRLRHRSHWKPQPSLYPLYHRMMINIFKYFSLNALYCVCIVQFYSILYYYSSLHRGKICNCWYILMFSGCVIHNFIIIMYYSIYSSYSYKEFLLGKNIASSCFPLKIIYYSLPFVSGIHAHDWQW